MGTPELPISNGGNEPILDSEVIAANLRDADVGLRERNKRDKLERIKTAALELFLEKGFEAATLRPIATRAGVSFGTLFRYAQDKRDLLFLVCNEDFDALAQSAFDDIPVDAPWVDQVLSIFRHFYSFYAERPALARDLLRELNFYDEGAQAARFTQSILQIEAKMEAFVIAASAQGLIDDDQDARIVARLLFSIYRAEIRRWVARGSFDVDNGLERLRPYLQTVIDGLQPQPGSV